MTIIKIKKALEEARRFENAAAEAIAYEKQEHGDQEPNDTMWASKAGGAVRRASMDLTRALANMRKVER